jgi:hypothetical protein
MAEITIDDIRQVIRDENASLASAKEMRELGVKFEDLEKKVDTALESVSKNLKIGNMLKDHESRIKTVETDNILLKSTVKLHSQQLK